MLDLAGAGALPILVLGLLLASLFVGGDGGSDSGSDVLGAGDSGDGGPGDDTPDLTDGPDNYSGNDGNDIITGLGGNDVLEGNRGDDGIDGGDGDDEIDGGSGDDLITDNAGDNVISGGDGDDTIFANNGDNTVFGGPGDDVIAVGAGASVVNGGEGDDTIRIDDAEARAFGNAGDDVMTDLAGGFMSGGEGNDAMSGIGGRYAGDAGDDVLAAFGDEDPDTEEEPTTALVGGEGDDALWAVASGKTQMTGDAGADSFFAGANAFVFDFNPEEDTLELLLTTEGDAVPEDAPEVEVTLSEFTNEDDEPVTVVSLSLVNEGEDGSVYTNLDTKVLLRGVSTDDISADDIALTILTEDFLNEQVTAAVTGANEEGEVDGPVVSPPAPPAG